MNEVEPRKDAGEADPELLVGTDRRFGVAVARYNHRLSSRLLEGARRCFIEHGVAEDDVAVVEVPGAWEIPTALRWLARSRELDGLVAVGVVIRGETPHFDYVCRGCADGCLRVGLELDLPVAFGVLTCDDVSQAQARAGGSAGDKGEEAALAVLEMANLRRRLVGS